MTAQRVVVDASVALAWFLPDSAQNVQLARRVLEAQENETITALVPDFWAAEITHRLLAAVELRRPRRIAATHAAEERARRCDVCTRDGARERAWRRRAAVLAVRRPAR